MRSASDTQDVLRLRQNARQKDMLGSSPKGPSVNSKDSGSMEIRGSGGSMQVMRGSDRQIDGHSPCAVVVPLLT